MKFKLLSYCSKILIKQNSTKMKKLLVFTLLFGLIVFFQSCGKTEKTETTTDKTTTEKTETTEKSEDTPKGGAQNFSMINNTGMVLVDVFIAPSDSDDWGDDVIPTDVVQNGETFDFTFSDVSPDECMWDILFTGEDGVEYYMRKVDLCNTSTITLTMN